MRQALTMVQVEYQNPHASMPMIMPVLIQPNTAPEIIDANVRKNSKRKLPWLYESEPHGGTAIICGGGPSIADHLREIKELHAGGVVFALNGAAGWLNRNGVVPDWQVIVDAKPSSASFCNEVALGTLLCSAVSPKTVSAAKNPTLFHLNFDDIESQFPKKRREMGGYTLVGGGVSVGITAMVLAYVMGFRDLRLFGYDSCNRGGATHAYLQPQNKLMPNMNVEWAGKTYNASMAMKLQAEAFWKFAAQLEEEGCKLEVYGEGLLQAMWKQPPATEREKYQKVWAFPEYRKLSPGECTARQFAEVAKPDGTVIDYGTGTGRGALAIRGLTGQQVIAVDFVDNCRDVEACTIPFVQHDLTEPLTIRAPYGYCTDVLEHIPGHDLSKVISNILAASPRTFFQIATIPDVYGSMIGQPLHLSVHPHGWWRIMLIGHGCNILWEEQTEMHSKFYVVKEPDHSMF